MLRALLCSFDWTTGVLHRETVVRMETTVLNWMERIGQVQMMLDSGRPADLSNLQTSTGGETSR